MGASLLSCHWTLVHLDHRAEERKMVYGRILERNERGMKKRKFPFLRPVNPRVPKRVLGGVVEQMSKFEISNGHNWGAIWSYRAVSTTPGTARTSSCSGEGSQGAWGLGLWEKVEKCFLFCFTFVLTCLENMKTRNWSDLLGLG